MDMCALLEADRDQIELEIARRFPAQMNCTQQTIWKAMQYSLAAGGKRLRPALTLAFCRLCGGETKLALPFAVAAEMVHTYSLIHDDLPCMDNDDLRRGKPTSHKVFGEGMAVLAGDALLTMAFALCMEADVEAQSKCAAVHTLSRCAGADGMIGGQVIDLESEGRDISLDTLIELQTLKTGALLEAACALGCIAAGGTETQLSAARDYAYNLGLAFQIQDDILDIEGDSAVLGKSIGKDKKCQKATFPTLLGLAACKDKVREYTELATRAISNISGSDYLIWLAQSLISRNH